jgi:hypothetical protein
MNLEGFHLSLFKGNIFKELVKALFEESGYIVVAYGYEGPFSQIKNKIAQIETSSPTALRIRHSPDLLIYDDKTNNVRLVEIKMSSYETRHIKRIEHYRKYWEDAVIVLVLPFENVFYAQEISNLGIKGYYDPKSDFKRIQDVFPRIESSTLSEYQDVARRMIEATKEKGNISKAPSKIPP